MFEVKDEVRINFEKITDYEEQGLKNIRTKEENVSKVGRVTKINPPFAQVDFWNSTPAKYTVKLEDLRVVTKASERDDTSVNSIGIVKENKPSPEHLLRAGIISDEEYERQLEQEEWADQWAESIKKEAKKVAETDKIIEEFTKKKSALDVQIAGTHYNTMPIQPIEFIHKNNLSFIQGNIIKYTCRYKDKNGLEDLKKVKHYVELLMELEYGE